MFSSLGQRLRAAREKRGLSIEDAAHLTRIPAFRLRHLEEDNYAGFGNLTYARAFLKLYSRFLRVDASEILTELPPARLGGRRDYRYLVEQYGRWVPEKREAFADLPAWSFQNRSMKSPFATACGAFIAVLIVAGVWGGHVAGERAQMAVEQEALEVESDFASEPLGDRGRSVLAVTHSGARMETRAQEVTSLRAIPVEPAAAPVLLRDQKTMERP